MFCEKCGAELFSGDMFCPDCGAPVMAAPEPPMAPAPEPIPPQPPAPPQEPPKPAAENEKIDLSERHELVILTREEAISGCRKILEIDGRNLEITVPPHYDIQRSMFFQGLGYHDRATGKTGDLKVDFVIQ